MRFLETKIPGAWVIEPSPHQDDRGRFMRAWCSREFEAQNIHFVPVQANLGSSKKAGTIRGMHYQTTPALEAKLVRCTKGSAFDVLIDLRKGSKTYGAWFGVELSVDNGRMLYVPEHCAHGYQSLEDDSDVYYMTSQFYSPAAVRGVKFDDPAFGIDWPLAATSVSDQDRNWPSFKS
jgi:dTDP-4-dehydrorhamnose 3,5-epimerase